MRTAERTVPDEVDIIGSATTGTTVTVNNQAVANAGVPRIKVAYAYDHRGRRVSKEIYAWNSSSNEYQVSRTHSFIYDGWNLISEICDQSSEIRTNRFVWGLDLSGTLEGAGGIGGLLSASLGGSSSTSTVVYCFDGNGNVTDLVDTNGTLVAHYTYDPYGNLLNASGPEATNNPFRFSTKYFDTETGLYCYGYRYYSPALGRWLSRDPMEEEEGANLYPFTANAPTISIDPLGLEKKKIYIEFVPRAQFDPLEKAMQPQSAHYVRTAAEMVSVIDQDIRKPFDPHGKCLDCIDLFVISDHGKGRGVVPLGHEMWYSSESFDDYLWWKRKTGEKGERWREWLDKKSADLAMLKEARGTLYKISTRMCWGGTFVLLSCESGKGPQGDALRAQLQAIFGRDVTIVLYSGDCGYVFGKPMRRYWADLRQWLEGQR